MSDSPSDYIHKVRAMFAEVEDQVDDIVARFAIKAGADLVIKTYGPGNQWPTTEYIATGRLRAGWNVGTETPPSHVSLMGDSGRDDDWHDHATATIGRLAAEISGLGVTPTLFFWNSVGYAKLVHEGEGGHAHIGRRPWVELVALNGQTYLDQARAEVMR